MRSRAQQMRAYLNYTMEVISMHELVIILIGLGISVGFVIGLHGFLYWLEKKLNKRTIKHR